MLNKLLVAAGGERRHVGIATFDTTMHFYSMRPDQDAFQMLIVPDNQKPYSPAFHTSLLVPLSQCQETVRTLIPLESITQTFHQVTKTVM